MTLQPTAPLAAIDPGLDFSVAGVLGRIPAEQQRALYGDLSRAEFEGRLFSFVDFQTLPVGHLLDHRVVMPLARAEWLIDQSSATIANHCMKMLCASDHSQAARMLSSALRLDLPDYATRARALAEGYRPFVIDCLRGLLGDAEAAIEPWMPCANDMRELLAKSAILFGALEVQLLALRQKRIADYRLGLAHGSDTVGAILTDQTAMVNAILHAKKRLSKQPPKGRRPQLFPALESSALATQAAYRHAFPDVTEDQLELQLKTTLTTLIDLFHLDENMFALSREDARSASRMRASTVMASCTAGEQLAFASIRLVTYARNVRGLITTGTTGRNPLAWFRGEKPSRSDRALETVLFINRVVVWSPSGLESAFDTRGDEVDLKGLLKTYLGAGTSAGEDLIKTVREERRAYFQRAPIFGDLVGAQLFDVLPDFRFRITRMSPPNPGSLVHAIVGHAQEPEQRTVFKVQPGRSADRTSSSGRGPV
ncbi:hypothetical protein [Sphingomonas sp. ID0503]|uniref:hypothetical protein n=1 Tax=Sphingomonas sp. ID0503 TaxID=3399691 RepID=UPI003AFAFDF0